MKSILATLPLLLASCATLPLEQTSTSSQLAISWWETQNQPSPNLTDWWSSFGDPELSRLVRLALEQHPDLASAAAAVREAQASRNETRSDLFPALDYSASRSTDRSVAFNGKDTTSHSFSSGLNASWEADLFGKNHQLVLAGNAAILAAQADLNSARASLAAETALAYLQLRSAETDLALVQDSIKSQEETTQLAQWREQAGEADSLEAEQALSSLESSRASISSLQQTIEELRNQLNLLTGQPPRTLNVSAEKPLPIPSRNLAAQFPADTVRQRPDVRADGYRWVQAIAQTQSVTAEQYPSLTLSGSLGLNSQGLSKIFDPQSLVGDLVVGVTGPIFDAGRIRSRIAVQNAAEEQTYHDYRSTLLTALSEVEDALIAIRRTQERITTLETAVGHAQSAAQLAASSYEAGVIDITQVLETQRSEITLERDLASTRLDYASAHVELYRALGGGY
ncbi:MAG: efflux transporter outer membrane subunit [Verrucomicrobiota bacterium JB023]|nr:efflux transporter outer membrane subunit [Verrucomicrobiota bacterium JB023]